MHLLDRYSLGCAAKIDRPQIVSKYFPLIPEKYITIHTTSKDAKSYDYFQEVVDILYPVLTKAGIVIVQIGGKDDKRLERVIDTCGGTNLGQTHYLIRGAMLHLGVDSFPVHFASALDKKLVVLYANTNFVDCVRPYWGNKNNQILLLGNSNGKKPSFSYQEHPKTINSIKTEDIARAVCKLLNLEFEYPYKTFKVGDQFLRKVVEGIPNQVVDISNLRIDSLILRMDVEFNETILQQQLSVCPCSIVTNRPININILKNFRPRVKELIYLVEAIHFPWFVSDVQKLGIPCHLFSYLGDDDIREIKLDYIDIGLINRKTITRINSEKLFYKSNKFILSNSKIFPCFSAMKKGISIPSVNPVILPVDDSSDFWIDSEHYLFLELTSP